MPRKRTSSRNTPTARAGGGAICSLRELARLTGVSVATASRIFSGRGPVKPATRERVLAVAEKAGFRPSAIGQVAFGGKTKSIGVLAANLSVSYFADILVGIQDRLLADGYLPIILQKFTPGAGINDCRGIERLIEHRVDGLILQLSDERLTRDDLLPLVRAELPVVSIGSHQALLACDTVETDDVAGGCAAGTHLVSIGHRRIAYTYYGEGTSSCDRRVEGLRRAMAGEGLVLDEKLVATLPPRGDAIEERLRDDLRRVLGRPKSTRPTAIFATTDLLALEVYAVAGELGLSIPSDLSVVGYADLTFAAHVAPPLTTVRQSGGAVGRIAADLMLARIAAPRAPVARELVPVEFVSRGSTAAR